MTGFRAWKSVKRPYAEQAKICYTCLNYDREPKRVRDKIDRLCLEVGGEYAKALKVYLTTEVSIPHVSRQYFVAERTLQRRAAEFLRAW